MSDADKTIMGSALPAFAVLAIFTAGVAFVYWPEEDKSSEIELALGRLSLTSQQCLYDVEEKGRRFETSENCGKVDGLSKEYDLAVVHLDPVPLEYESKELRARMTAWKAKALSLGKRLDEPVSLVVSGD